MKKRIICLILAVVMCLSVGMVVSAQEFNTANRGSDSTENVLLSIPMNSGTRALKARNLNGDLAMSYSNISGKTTGPSDYCVDGSAIYVLNSANNSIAQFNGGALNSVVDLDDYGITALKVAADKNELFALGTELDIVRIEDDASHSYNIASFVDSVAVEDFKVINDKLYVSNDDGEHGKTYCFDISQTNNLQFVAEYPGRIFDETTQYECELIRDPGKIVGTGCIMTITDLVTGESTEITLTSDYCVLGAQYLGMEGEYYKIKFYEATNDSDYKIVTAETIRLVDQNGKVIAIRNVPDQVIGFCCSTKDFDGADYQIVTTPTVTEIRSADDLNYTPVKQYISPLAAVESPTIDDRVSTTESIAPYANSITRLQILKNAKSYYTDFKWTCSSNNIGSASSRPSFITGAGTYTTMPYAWGQWHSKDEFITGLANGGQAGNVSSEPMYNAYGMDCSGFVSRCWALDNRYYTGSFHQISTKITLGELMVGDALNKTAEPGAHIFLGTNDAGYGSITSYEATRANNLDRVWRQTWSSSDLTGYTPIKYNNVIG